LVSKTTGVIDADADGGRVDRSSSSDISLSTYIHTAHDIVACRQLLSTGRGSALPELLRANLGLILSFPFLFELFSPSVIVY